MKVMRKYVDSGELCIGDFESFRIFLFVEFSAQSQPCLGSGSGNAFDDWAKAAQGFAARVDADERKKPMRDFVPLTGSRRQVAHGDRELEFVSQFLQFDFPQTDAIAIRPAAVSGHQKTLGFRIAFLSHGLPPAAEGVDRKSRRVGILSPTEPAP